MAVSRARAMGFGLAVAVALAFGIVVVALRGPSPPAGGPPAAATDAVGSGAPAETQPSRVRRRVRRAGEVSAPDAGGQAEPAPEEPAPEEHPPAVVVVAPATDSSDRSEAGLAVLERYLDMGADVSGVMSNYDTMRARIRTTAGPLRRIESEGERTRREEATITVLGCAPNARDCVS